MPSTPYSTSVKSRAKDLKIVRNRLQEIIGSTANNTATLNSINNEISLLETSLKQTLRIRKKDKLGQNNRTAVNTARAHVALLRQSAARKAAAAAPSQTRGTSLQIAAERRWKKAGLAVTAIKPIGLAALQTHTVENEARKAARKKEIEEAERNAARRGEELANRVRQNTAERKKLEVPKFEARLKLKKIATYERENIKGSFNNVFAEIESLNKITNNKKNKELAKIATRHIRHLRAEQKAKMPRKIQNKITLGSLNEVRAALRKAMNSGDSGVIKTLRETLRKHTKGSFFKNRVLVRANRNFNENGRGKNNAKKLAIKSELNSILKNTNHTTIKTRVDGLNKNFPGWRKIANQNDQRRLAALQLQFLENANFMAAYNKLGFLGRRELKPENKAEFNARKDRITAARAAARAPKPSVGNRLRGLITRPSAASAPSGFRSWIQKRTAAPAPKFNNATLRKAVQNHFSGVSRIYNKAVISAILKSNIPLSNTQRTELQRAQQTRAGRFAGALGRGAGAAGGALGSGAVVAGRALGRGAGAAVAYLMKPRIEKLIEIINNPRTRRGERENAIRELYAISKDLRTRMNNKTKAETFLGTLGNLNSIVKGQKAPGLVSQVLGPSSTNFLPVEYVKNSNGNYIINSNGKRKAAPPPLGYVLKSYYNKNGNQTPGYFKIKNSKTLQSQLEYMGNGPRRNNRGGSGPSAPSGGIVFAPKINVGAARIGAQTFGGTRVGGQQMGGSRVRTGNAGSTTLKTGNTGGVQVSNSGKANVGTRPANTGLTVSAPTTNGSRQLAATSEQLIRGAGGAEAVEKGIKALNAANGNVARAKAASKLPTNTFTNIYAMGGPVAAKKAVAARRRRRTVGGRRVGTGTRGAPGKKKRVAPKPRKQYIKLTPYQFRRLTDHIKKNNLRKVLIKEITH